VTVTRDVVVTIDGPAGAGKSTVARQVATRAGLRYLDTGATYRAITLGLLNRAVRLDDPDRIAAAAPEVRVELRPDLSDPSVLRVWLDGAEPGLALRTSTVTAVVPAVAAVPAVRDRLAAVQRAATRPPPATPGGRCPPLVSGTTLARISRTFSAQSAASV
jgi:cytidylate kinase